MRAPARRLPASVLLRDFTDALAQQMFYWGRDVIHPQGNLLVAHGFDRRPSQGLKGTSCYRKTLDAGFVELHGACVGWYPGAPDETAFLYIRNRRRCYLYSGPEPPTPGHYREERLRTEPSAQRLALSHHFLDWWLAYEEWIATTAGPSYREACHHTSRQLPKARPWLPPDTGLAWLRAYRKEPESAGRARRRKLDPSRGF